MVVVMVVTRGGADILLAAMLLRLIANAPVFSFLRTCALTTILLPSIYASINIATPTDVCTTIRVCVCM